MEEVIEFGCFTDGPILLSLDQIHIGTSAFLRDARIEPFFYKNGKECLHSR